MNNIIKNGQAKKEISLQPDLLDLLPKKQQEILSLPVQRLSTVRPLAVLEQMGNQSI
jgi:hypothetical protein